MTHLERVQAVLQGRTPDRVPVIPQCFMFSAQEYGYNIGQINRNPRLLAEAHAFCQEKYGYDGCVIDIDDASLAEACGAKVIYREDAVAAVDEHHPLLEDLSEIDDLELPDPAKSTRLCVWMETAQRLMEMVGDHVFVLGRADQGPFDLLTLLRGPQEFMMDLLTEDEDVIHHALQWATEAHIRFAKAMRDLTHATSMGDSYAGPNLISPNLYRQFALPYEKQVVSAVQTPDKPYSVHICGDTTKILEDMATNGARIVEVDWQVDMGKARAIFPENVTIMGNVDPSDPLVLGSPEQVKAKAKAIIEATGGKGLILSSGCAMGANTKPENMAALVESAKLYGTFYTRISR